MIEFIHKYPILIKILLTVTTVAFVGTGGYFLGQDTAQYAASVGGEKITLQQLQKAEYNLEDFYRKIYQGNDDMLKNYDFAKMALDQLIERKIMLIEADKAGLDVGDDEIASAVRDNASFRDQQGNFSKAIYTEVLRMNNMTPKDYEELLREDLKVRKFRKMITDSVVVTEVDLREYFKEQQEAKGLPFDEQAFSENREQLMNAVQSQNNDKAVRTIVENLKSQMEIKIYPEANIKG